MEIGGISGLAGISEAVSDRKSIADNFDAFLQLLTTQLKNQNPLDPLDSNEFTDQLVKFSTVEQNVKTNENLEAMLRLTSASLATAAVGYIGKTITAEGVVAELKDGQAKWSYSLAKPAPNSTVSVKNATGDVVYTRTAALESGSNTFTWDGISTTGTPMPPGSYTLEVVARDSQGGIVNVETSVGGIIDSVDLSGADPVLISGSKKIPLSTVTFIGA